MLNEALENSNSVNILESVNIDIAYSKVPQEIRNNIFKLIKYLVDTHETFIKQIHQEQSPFCRYYTELCNQIGVYYSVFILDVKHLYYIGIKLFLI